MSKTSGRHFNFLRVDWPTFLFAVRERRRWWGNRRMIPLGTYSKNLESPGRALKKLWERALHTASRTNFIKQITHKRNSRLWPLCNLCIRSYEIWWSGVRFDLDRFAGMLTGASCERKGCAQRGQRSRAGSVGKLLGHWSVVPVVVTPFYLTLVKLAAAVANGLYATSFNASLT